MHVIDKFVLFFSGLSAVCFRLSMHLSAPLPRVLESALYYQPLRNLSDFPETQYSGSLQNSSRQV
jgi:hypothetical protein